MKEFLLTATYLVGVGELLLAAYFWKTNSGNEIRRVMALFSLSLSVWVISSALTAYTTEKDYTFFLVDLIYFSGLLLVTLLFHFTLIFPYPFFRIDFFHRIGLYIPVIIFSIIIFFSNTIVADSIFSADSVGSVIGGPLFTLYNFYLLSLYLCSIFLLFLRTKKTDGFHKRFSRIAFFSVLIGGLPAVIIDLVLTVVAPNFPVNPLLANLLTASWLGATSYAVLQRA